MKTGIRVAIGTGLALLIPAILTLLALWHWKPGAFVLAALLLLGGARLLYDLLTKNRMNNKTYRSAVVLALVTVIGLAWMNIAVGGILGDDPANMMYFGVLLVGVAGAGIVRWESQGMSNTLFATAFAVALVPVIAWFIGTNAFANGFPAVFGLHAVFALLFSASALLFRRSAAGSTASLHH